MTQKIAIWVPSHKPRIDNRKKLVKLQYVLHMSSQYANFCPLTAEVGAGVWGTQQISTSFASCLRHCSDIAHRRPTKLRTIFVRLLGWYTIYTFSGALAPDRILPSAKCTLRSSLAFAYIGSVTARHSSSGRQPNFAASYKEWNSGTFVEGAT